MDDDDYNIFKAYGEYTYVKLAILFKRDRASEYLEKWRALRDDIEYNKIQKEFYFEKFKSAAIDLYIKILPYLIKIKNKTEYEKLDQLLKKPVGKEKPKSEDDFIELFILLNKAIYTLGISDLNMNIDDPANALGR